MSASSFSNNCASADREPGLWREFNNVSCVMPTSGTTMNIYGDAETADMHSAHEKVVRLAMPKSLN
jgi:hypothetical protein